MFKKKKEKIGSWDGTSTAVTALQMLDTWMRAQPRSVSESRQLGGRPCLHLKPLPVSVYRASNVIQ